METIHDAVASLLGPPGTSLRYAKIAMKCVNLCEPLLILILK